MFFFYCRKTMIQELSGKRLLIMDDCRALVLCFLLTSLQALYIFICLKESRLLAVDVSWVIICGRLAYIYTAPRKVHGEDVATLHFTIFINSVSF